MILRNRKRETYRESAFSLVEVVVAVGIFAIAVVTIIGLLGPLNQSVANVRDGDDAVRVVSIIQAELQRAGVPAVKAFIDNGDTLYANKSGSKIAKDGLSSPWDSDVPDLDEDGITDDFEKDAQKFFEIKLTAAPGLPFDSTKSGFFAFNIEIRWPGYVIDSPTSARKIAADANAHDQQSVLIVPAAITQ